MGRSMDFEADKRTESDARTRHPQREYHYDPRSGDPQHPPDESADFERTFAEAQAIIASMPGYVSHQLLRCLEAPDQYIFLVHWHTLEDHTQGFLQSTQYQEWKRLLHHFYEPFPTVEHYETVFSHTG